MYKYISKNYPGEIKFSTEIYTDLQIGTLTHHSSCAITGI